MDLGHCRQQARDLIPAQHHGYALGGVRPADFLHPGEINAQHAFIEEEQGGERLLVRGRRGLTLIGQKRKERFNLGRPHFPRMPQAVKTNEPADPVEVSLFGADTVMRVASPLAYLVQQSGRLERWGGEGLHGHHPVTECIYSNTSGAGNARQPDALCRTQGRRRFPSVNRLAAQLFTFKCSGRPLTRRAFLCLFGKLLSGHSKSWPLNPLRPEKPGHLLTGFSRSCFL